MDWHAMGNCLDWFTTGWIFLFVFRDLNPRLHTIMRRLRLLSVSLMAFSMVWETSVGHHSLISRCFTLGFGTYWLWQMWKDKDDDDWWKRKRKRALVKVKQVAGKLVVVPLPSPVPS